MNKSFTVYSLYLFGELKLLFCLSQVVKFPSTFFKLCIKKIKLTILIVEVLSLTLFHAIISKCFFGEVNINIK